MYSGSKDIYAIYLGIESEKSDAVVLLWNSALSKYGQCRPFKFVSGDSVDCSEKWIRTVWSKRHINPFTPRAPKTGLTILEIFYLQKYFFEKKAQCLLEATQQLSFKYFANFPLIANLFSNVRE